MPSCAESRFTTRASPSGVAASRSMRATERWILWSEVSLVETADAASAMGAIAETLSTRASRRAIIREIPPWTNDPGRRPRELLAEERHLANSRGIRRFDAHPVDAARGLGASVAAAVPGDRMLARGSGAVDQRADQRPTRVEHAHAHGAASRQPIGKAGRAVGRIGRFDPRRYLLTAEAAGDGDLRQAERFPYRAVQVDQAVAIAYVRTAPGPERVYRGRGAKSLLDRVLVAEVGGEKERHCTRNVRSGIRGPERDEHVERVRIRQRALRAVGLDAQSSDPVLDVIAIQLGEVAARGHEVEVGPERRVGCARIVHSRRADGDDAG